MGLGSLIGNFWGMGREEESSFVGSKRKDVKYWI